MCIRDRKQPGHARLNTTQKYNPMNNSRGRTDHSRPRAAPQGCHPMKSKAPPEMRQEGRASGPEKYDMPLSNPPALDSDPRDKHCCPPSYLPLCSRPYYEASVTQTVKLTDSAVVGVPESNPSLVRLRPSGSCPLVTVKEYGGIPPPAVNWKLYGTPTEASGGVLEVISNILM